MNIMLKNFASILIFGFFSHLIYSQNTLEITVISDEDKSVLVGASVYLKGTQIGNTTNIHGVTTLSGIPNGNQTLIVSFVGFEAYQLKLLFPLKNNRLTIALHEDESSLETVVISSTRSRRSISQIPTRIEVIGAEELSEKAAMNSANIAMLLRESTGIQMQQTSANSANQSIRIQGLDGRFTQLLKDGFPLFGGFSSGLSIMQIPPLDLQQVEIIKGSSSTLYGGGAIAGLVNLISKKPNFESETTFMLDLTSRKGATVNAYYSKRNDRFGMSLFGSTNLQQASDVNNDVFSDLPKVKSISFNPSFYYYPSEAKTLRITFNISDERRVGGDIRYVNQNTTPQQGFFEENKSSRYAMKSSYDNEISESSSFHIKNSLSYFNRDLLLPTYQFLGSQFASFTEVTYNRYSEKSDWVFGANIITEDFTETPTTALDRSYQQFTSGAFAQNNLTVSGNMSLETGLRIDYNNNYGTFLLPRVSLFYKFSDALTSRIGGGLGYKIPTIFTEDSELRAYQQVLPINPDSFKAETSAGVNLDLNYKTTILDDAVSMSFNQLFFYTQLNNSLVLTQQGQDYTFLNATNPLDSYGFETNLKFKYKDFILFTNYAFNNVKVLQQQKALTPKHNFGGVLMYEVHEKWRIGYEAYYKSSQFRTDLTQTPSYWTMGFMAMRTFGKISVYANFENFTDNKQSNYQSMITGSANNPEFSDIWAPTDGFVFNGGILIKL